MIVPDVNLLIYATDTRSFHHQRAVAWWSGVLNGLEPVALTWSTVLAFVRLTTSRRVFEDPLSLEESVRTVQFWLGCHHVITIEPTARHLDLLTGLLGPTGTAGNLVTDAHLAALALEHGATLCSADADFGRFPGLIWSNPLSEPA